LKECRVSAVIAASAAITCPPSEAEKILRKNINGVVSAFLDRQPHGGKLAHSKMLYRRMRLVYGKPLAEMNREDLEKVWVWARQEYGGNNG
jgi:hypothetical protein